MSAPALGAQGATFRGKVLTDSTELPIAGAVVSIDDLKLQAASDSAGNFAIIGIKPGAYVVTAKKIGFGALATRVRFAAGVPVWEEAVGLADPGGGVAATSVVVTNATTITAVTPAQSAPGAAIVTVMNPDTQSGSHGNAYTFTPLAAPTVSAVTPNTGAAAGGTTITVTGTNTWNTAFMAADGETYSVLVRAIAARRARVEVVARVVDEDAAVVVLEAKAGSIEFERPFALVVPADRLHPDPDGAVDREVVGAGRCGYYRAGACDGEVEEVDPFPVFHCLSPDVV